MTPRFAAQEDAPGPRSAANLELPFQVANRPGGNSLAINHGIGVIAHWAGVIDHALQSTTGVIAYGVRVSAYGISQQGLHRPRKRLRSSLGDTGSSARSVGPLVSVARDVPPAVDIARLKHLIVQNHLLPIPRA